MFFLKFVLTIKTEGNRTNTMLIMTYLNEKEKDFLKKIKEKLTLTQEESGLPMITLTQEESGLSKLDYNLVASSFIAKKWIKAMGETDKGGYIIVKLTMLGVDNLQNHPDL